MSTTTLTTTQHAMLAHAIHHAEGRVDWFPENIKGGARQKVLQGLFNRALITSNGVDHFVAAEGYDALGCARPNACLIAPDPELDAAVAQAEGSWAQGVDTDEPAPATQAAADDVCIQTEIQLSEHDNATGCDECPAGPDVCQHRESTRHRANQRQRQRQPSNPLRRRFAPANTASRPPSSGCSSAQKVPPSPRFARQPAGKPTPCAAPLPAPSRRNWA
jgi:hypothetical protein